MGAGKTTFIKQLAELGVMEATSSPTFSLMNIKL
jgi:tRNA A37 threonylcarbamoyladenosine biosynthesis protein TsaE